MKDVGVWVQRPKLSESQQGLSSRHDGCQGSRGKVVVWAGLGRAADLCGGRGRVRRGRIWLWSTATRCWFQLSQLEGQFWRVDAPETPTGTGTGGQGVVVVGGREMEGGGGTLWWALLFPWAFALATCRHRRPRSCPSWPPLNDYVGWKGHERRLLLCLFRRTVSLLIHEPIFLSFFYLSFFSSANRHMRLGPAVPLSMWYFLWRPGSKATYAFGTAISGLNSDVNRHPRLHAQPLWRVAYCMATESLPATNPASGGARWNDAYMLRALWTSTRYSLIPWYSPFKGLSSASATYADLVNWGSRRFSRLCASWGTSWCLRCADSPVPLHQTCCCGARLLSGNVE